MLSHSLHISKIFSQEILEIKKIEWGKVLAYMNTYESNRLISNNSLARHNLKAFISSHRILRTGIVRDVPQDFSMHVLKELISSPIKILEIHRLNHRIKTGNEFQYVPSRTVCIKFTGQSLQILLISIIAGILFFHSYLRQSLLRVFPYWPSQ